MSLEDQANELAEFVQSDLMSGNLTYDDMLAKAMEQGDATAADLFKEAAKAKEAARKNFSDPKQFEKRWSEAEARRTAAGKRERDREENDPTHRRAFVNSARRSDAAARDARDRANKVKAATTHSHGDPKKVQAARDAAKAAKAAAKEAKKAARDARNAGKYGTKAEREEADRVAKEKAAKARAMALAAEKLLKEAETKPEAPPKPTPPPPAKGPDDGKQGPPGAPETPGAPAASSGSTGTAPPSGVWPDCGPEDGCGACDPPCNADQECKCHWEEGAEIDRPEDPGGTGDGGGDSDGGGKGKGDVGGKPSISSPDSRPTGSAPPPGAQGTPPQPAPVSPPQGPEGDTDTAKKPGDGPGDDKDKAYLKKVKQLMRSLGKHKSILEKKYAKLMLKAARILDRHPGGLGLTAGEEGQLGRIFEQATVTSLAVAFVDGLMDSAALGGAIGLATQGAERDKVLSAIKGLESVGRHAGSIMQGAFEQAKQDAANARKWADRGYTPLDESDAQHLLDAARAKTPGEESFWAKGKQLINGTLEYALRKNVVEARDAIVDLGLDRDKVDVKTVAQELYRKRRDAEMKAADDAAGYWSITGSWIASGFRKVMDPVGRGLGATEKLIEAGITTLQAGATAEVVNFVSGLKALGADVSTDAFENTLKEQTDAVKESYVDAWRLLAKKDMELVRNRITQATLGGASLAATADEQLVGEDAFLGWARSVSHFTSAAASVSVGYLAAGAPLGGLGSAAGNAAALATVRGLASQVGQALKNLATAVPRTAEEWGSAIRNALKSEPRGPIRWGPATGEGPLGLEEGKNFRSASYTADITRVETILYHVYGGRSEQMGRFLTRIQPTGPLQAQIDLALVPKWGNTATRLATARIPPGVTYYEGAAAEQGSLFGGGSQVVVPEATKHPEWWTDVGP